MKWNVRTKKKFDIRAKLLGSFMLIVGIAIIGGVFALFEMYQIYQTVNQVNTKITPAVYTMGQIQIKVDYFFRLEFQHILADDDKTRSDIYDKLDKTGTEIRALIKKYQDSLASDATDRQHIDTIEARWRTFEAYSSAIIVKSSDNKDQEALALLNGDSIKELLTLENALDAASQYNQKLATGMAVTTNSIFYTAMWLTIVIFIFVFAGALVLGLWISNTFSYAINLLMRAAWHISNEDIPILSEELNAVAEGDLTRATPLEFPRVIYNSSDELGELANAFNDMLCKIQNMGSDVVRMTENLRTLMRQVSENADHLSEASTQMATAAGQAGQATNQISTTIQQVARGITQQTESVNKMTSSIEQMGYAIDGVAKGAQEQSMAVSKASTMTSELSSIIYDVAVQSKQQAEGASTAMAASNASARTVENTVQGMQTIKLKVDLSARKVEEMGKRSEEIGNIVETISDIASQTNLLSLNAAIEAARAGEHGKGFAVVADEVRKLAEKSAAATKEIAALVRTIQQTVNEAVKAMKESAVEVDKGVSQAQESRQSLDAILQASTEGLQIGGNLSNAASQMNTLAGDLVGAMESVSAVVEENTASTEEMSASSDEVNLAVEAFASISEENSASVEEVSASTEEMNAQVDDVNNSAQSLAEMAVTLQQLVAQFKI
jgi:methyl-accepting chemotaxis protein